MTAFFLDKGAVETKPLTENYKSFVLETSAGLCKISIDLGQSSMYSIYACFENVQLANTKDWFKEDGNQYSGKYNYHSTDVILDNAVYYAKHFFLKTL